MKIRNLDKVLDEIGDFGRITNESLNNIFLVSLWMLFLSSNQQHQSINTVHRTHLMLQRHAFKVKPVHKKDHPQTDAGTLTMSPEIPRQAAEYVALEQQSIAFSQMK